MAHHPNQRRNHDERGPRGGGNVLPSPYNFVPLSDLVITDWAEGRPSQDKPYAEGLSGRLDIEISSAGPLLVSGPGEGVKRFFTVNGCPTIPGSSLRGMIRNVVEIMSFSRLSRISDRRFGLRDLSGAAPEYTKQMTSGNRGSGFSSMVDAAWLSRDGRGWRLQRCEFARVQHDDLETIAAAAGNRAWRADVKNLQGAQGRPNIPGDLKQGSDQDPASLASMYLIWRDNPRKIAMKVEPEPTGHRHSRDNILNYAQAFPLAAHTQLRTMQTEGELVFTGQPSKKKHMEFLFHSEEAEDEEAPKDVMRDFLDVNADGPGWTFWNDQLNTGKIDRIPVFIATDKEGGCAAIGLSMMFRYPQTYSTHQMRDHTSRRHGGCDGYDLAERMFGRIDERDQAAADGIAGTSFQGRVAFGDAPIVNSSAAAEQGPHKTVLGAPKPQYFPGYVRQTAVDNGKIRNAASQGRNPRYVYRKYMEDGTAPKPELRGWKRYPARKGAVSATPPLPPPGASDAATVELAPLAPRGADPMKFKARVRFHNLLPFELGALVWALRFGGAEGARHSIGMGKPFGWGQIGLTISGVEIEPNTMAAEANARPMLSNAEAAPSLKACATAFTLAADDYFDGKWRDSAQVRTLVSMATPMDKPPHPLVYPVLQVPGRNQFQEAKGDGLYLVDWPGLGDGPDARPKPTKRGAEPPPDTINGGSGGRPDDRARRPQPVSTYAKGDKVKFKGRSSIATVTGDQAYPNSPVSVVWPDGKTGKIPPAKIEPA